MKRITTTLTLSVMFITGLLAQNIGIGTPSPDYTLDVNGQLGINDYVYHNDDINNDTYMGFSAENQWEVVTGGKEMIKADGDTGEVIVNPNGTDQTKFMVIGDAIEHLLQVDPTNDRVGIGTATPAHLLDVDGDFRVIGDAIEHLLYIDSANDAIGIGKADPEYLVDVDGDLRVIGDAIEHLLLVNSSTNRVGIGNADPQYMLDVQGDLRVVGDGINHLLYVDTDSNNVGINNDTPTERLDVNGKIKATGLQLVSPLTGAVTNFEQLSTGNQVVPGGNAAGGVLTASINFPTVFFTVPQILVTVQGTDAGPEQDATFIASVRQTNSTGVVVNIVRVDGGTIDGSWTQNLVISWMAWE